jgi:hypothetical protein
MNKWVEVKIKEDIYPLKNQHLYDQYNKEF